MAIGCWGVCGLASADGPSDQQIFRVHVPQRVGLGDAESVVVTKRDPTDNDPQFSTQTFDVVSQTPAGAVVVFESQQVFRHRSHPAKRSDLRMRLDPPQASRWRVTQASDQTDYAAGRTIATVVAQSNQAGDARLCLRVELVDHPRPQTMTGDYETTVVATISAK
ncbi:hypothetical protein [Rosistilla carotiformis]|uniref:hypothetical protein n=1 Tax=Rosistilla carotiformis TaxID=2528017 RepID=UPI0011A869E8|nr:hypothetical protein [Rosistilla carotiformis]